MATQLQLRRGTTAENNAFTGAIGEVTVDTDTNALRVHDGSTTGGFMVDTVVAFQAPTAGNNYTWYRKYASGWVEQGGIVTSTTDADVTVTYPVAFNDTNYTLVFGVITQNDNASGLQWSGAKTMSASGFTAHVTDTVRKNWHAIGMAA